MSRNYFFLTGLLEEAAVGSGTDANAIPIGPRLFSKTEQQDSSISKIRSDGDAVAAQENVDLLQPQTENELNIFKPEFEVPGGLQIPDTLEMHKV